MFYDTLTEKELYELLVNILEELEDTLDELNDLGSFFVEKRENRVIDFYAELAVIKEKRRIK